MRSPILALLALLLSYPLAAQDPGSVTAEQMAEYRRLASPGPAHARLARLAGTWDMDIMFAVAPGQTQRVHAVAENRAILGGRFLISEARSTEPFLGQDTIESVTIFGFDRRSGAWTVFGLDSFGTYHVDAEGVAPEDSEIVTMSGNNVDPRTERSEPFDWVLHFVDDDTYVTEILFLMPNGAMHKAVEITHRRRR